MTTAVPSWLAEQAHHNRALLLIVDRQAEPDPIVQLFGAGLMTEYINLYQGSALDELASIGPWLVRLHDPHAPLIREWLEVPQRHWGWLASTAQPDLKQLAQHWRERMLVDEHGQQSIYRFQDNRVIARHLQALEPAQRPGLLGPFVSALAWNGHAWQSIDNPAPGPIAVSGTPPWLQIQEPQAITQAIQRHNLELWLWQTHAAELCQLVEKRDFTDWREEQLAQAEAWGWASNESLQFLLAYRLHPDWSDHTLWQPLACESAAAHLSRCQQAITHGNTQRPNDA